MPELPEVEALTTFLRARAVGRVVARVDVPGIHVLKTYDPPPSALQGLQVTGVARHGKFLDLTASGLHLVVHLSRAGWIRWRDAVPATPPRPSAKSPLAARVVLDDQSGLDVTEAGTKKRLAIYLVRDPQEVPGIATLGPDPLTDDFTLERFRSILQGEGRKQIKGVLRHQGTIAGIGNAYSDELLHAARLSPFKMADKLTDDELLRLLAALRETLIGALDRQLGQRAATLKGEKRAGLRVHARTGLPCPVCGDTVREVSFADTSLQYCPTCQTGGKPLADRRMSKLLR